MFLSIEYGHAADFNERADREAMIPGVAAVLFFSSLVRSTLGFGDALLAMPLLALLIGVRVRSCCLALEID